MSNIKVIFISDPDWKIKILSIASDGERKMTGCRQGCLTLAQNECSPNLIRIWCVLHQLDLTLQKSYKNFSDGVFYSQLTKLVGYCRRKATLVAELKSTCPYLQDTRWLSMAKVTSWLEKHRAEVKAYNL